MELWLENCILLDMIRDEPQRNATVVIDRGYIKEIGCAADFGTRANDDANLRIDLSGQYLLPGIADCHVHLTQALAPLAGGAEGLGLRSDASLAYFCAHSARSALLNGITMLRVVGEARFIDVELRNAINQGLLDGPRLVAGGHILIRTAGHGSRAINVMEFDGPDQAIKAVRMQVRGGADFIKLMVTGGVASMTDPVDVPQFLDEELEAACRAACGCGKGIAVHAGGPRAIEKCADLGVTSVEHGYIMDEQAVDALARNGTYLVPTLVVTHDAEYVNSRPKWIRDKVSAVGERHGKSFEMALRAGVKIVAGTDTPDFKEYIYRELELLYGMGMKGMDVLRACTRTAAEMCGLGTEAGAVTPGRRANLIAVGKDPLIPANLRDLRLVIKDGRVYRAGSPSPVAAAT